MSSAGRLQQADQDDLVGNFVVDRIEPVTAMLLAQAVDDDSMGRLLRISIKRWLIDQARQTAVGALRRRLEELLSAVEAFEQVPGREAWSRPMAADWIGRTAVVRTNGLSNRRGPDRGPGEDAEVVKHDTAATGR